jgi:hypothetical protein
MQTGEVASAEKLIAARGLSLVRRLAGERLDMFDWRPKAEVPANGIYSGARSGDD